MAAGDSRFGAAWESVLPAAQAGAGWAFTRLFEAFGRPVAGYLRSQNVADPDGLANEVFLRAFRSMSTFIGSEEKFRSWLFTIAHNVLIDERRRLGRRVAETGMADVVDLRGAPVALAAEDEALDDLAEERVKDMLAALAPDQRDVVMLRIVADMSIEDVASALGKSIGAIKQLQRRGLEALRREIARTAVSNPADESFTAV